MTIITRELLDAGRTGSGGWTATQINLLGIKWPPAKRWQAKVIGREIPEDAADLFLRIGSTLRGQVVQRSFDEPAADVQRTDDARGS